MMNNVKKISTIVLLLLAFMSVNVFAENTNIADSYENQVSVRFIQEKASHLPQTGESFSQNLEKFGVAMVLLVAIIALKSAEKSKGHKSIHKKMKDNE
jgi:LPXTG-motif cell wall-anchored protein